MKLAVFTATGGSNWLVIYSCRSVTDSTSADASTSYQIKQVEQPPTLITWANLERHTLLTLLLVLLDQCQSIKKVDWHLIYNGSDLVQN